MKRALAVLLLSCSLLLLGAPGVARVAFADPGATVATGLTVGAPASYDGDVRDLPEASPSPDLDLDELEGPNLRTGPAEESLNPLSVPAVIGPMPSPIQNFAGLSIDDKCPVGSGTQCGTGYPPDVNGDVGPSHYIQGVNAAYAIYDKTGTLLASFSENALFSGSGTLCETNSFGDPVVLYDHFADRWVLTHFAFTGFPDADGPFIQCFAVSKTADPVAGGWWLYAVRTDTGATGQPPIGALNDYGKFGIWNDGCLYFSYNEFAPSYIGAAFGTLRLSDMYSGSPVTGSLGFLPYPANAVFSMVPSNLTGLADAPAGTPNYFVSESISVYNWEVRKFTPAADCGAGGNLGAVTIVSQLETNWAGGDLVPQPGTTRKLDTLSDRVMQKVQYRKVGAAESLWVTNTVDANGVAAGIVVAPQWAQLDVTGGVVATVPVQEGIHTPDSDLSRWMGSIAADTQGNVALGYSTSSSTAYPSIAYAGRLAEDPPNGLTRSEIQLIAGSGSQTAFGRWGDYTAMSVDPTDDCTFWYTNEYLTASDNIWRTRIGSFKFAECVLDTTPPVTAITLDPVSPDGDNGWYVSDVTVSVSATDDVGVAETRCVLDPVSAPAGFDDIPSGCGYLDPGADVTADGEHTLYAASTDGAGNKEAVQSAAFKVDQTAPVTTISLDPAAPDGIHGWYVSDVTVSVDATDNAGVSETRCVLNPAVTPATFDDLPASCDYSAPGTSVTADGTYTVYAGSVDEAGNSDLTSVTFKIDQTPAEFLLSFDPVLGDLVVDGIDDNGIESVVMSGGGFFRGYTVTDAAGNETVVKMMALKLGFGRVFFSLTTVNYRGTGEQTISGRGLYYSSGFDRTGALSNFIAQVRAANGPSYMAGYNGATTVIRGGGAVVSLPGFVSLTIRSEEGTTYTGYGLLP